LINLIDFLHVRDFDRVAVVVDVFLGHFDPREEIHNVGTNGDVLERDREAPLAVAVEPEQAALVAERLRPASRRSKRLRPVLLVPWLLVLVLVLVLLPSSHSTTGTLLLRGAIPLSMH